jgi:hypothetical protein
MLTILRYCNSYFTIKATSTWGAPLPRSNGDAATSSIQSPLASYAAATSSLPPKPVIPQRRSSRMEQHIVTWALPQSYAAIVRTLATPSLESSMSFPTFPLSFFRQHFGIPMKKVSIGRSSVGFSTLTITSHLRIVARDHVSILIALPFRLS